MMIAQPTLDSMLDQAATAGARTRRRSSRIALGDHNGRAIQELARDSKQSSAPAKQKAPHRRSRKRAHVESHAPSPSAPCHGVVTDEHHGQPPAKKRNVVKTEPIEPTATAAANGRRPKASATESHEEAHCDKENRDPNSGAGSPAPHCHQPAYLPQDESTQQQGEGEGSYAYDSESYRNLREKEVTFKMDPNYIMRKQDLSELMRAMIVDWLIDVQTEFRLCNDTYFTAINLLDRYFQFEPSINRSNAQLVAITCMWIAAKLEDLGAEGVPGVDQMAYVCDGAFTTSQILDMEQRILFAVEFRVSSPTVNRLLQAQAHAVGLSSVSPLLDMAIYFAMLSLMDVRFLRYKRSVVAASCLHLAAIYTELRAWLPRFEKFTGYAFADLSPCMHDLQRAVCEPAFPHLMAVKNKYSTGPRKAGLREYEYEPIIDESTQLYY